VDWNVDGTGSLIFDILTTRILLTHFRRGIYLFRNIIANTSPESNARLSFLKIYFVGVV
jgi:hypothetical protein